LGPIAQLGERGTEDIHLPRSGVRSTFGPSFCVDVFLMENATPGCTAKRVVSGVSFEPFIPLKFKLFYMLLSWWSG
jgi:hypothetical protein